ncbi:MAG: Myo-inositol 2-dehydrogenase [Promethearchaeota archaeon]|nr:MAG: Myo-inositol 2-dehydrogenase [Candidatus Lokiarchaeota archaeon]
MPESYKVGIIGAGRIGRIHIENLVYQIPNVTLKTIADIHITPELNQWINNLGNLKITHTPEEIFEDEEIDAVIIASSTDTHALFIQKAAKAKKHIFCEKPIDTNISRIEHTLEMTEEEEIKLMIGFNRRFDPDFRSAYEVVKKGEIGTPHIIKITSRDPAPPPRDFIKKSGGLFADMTIHDWDMACFLSQSEVVEVYASGGVLIDPEIAKLGDIDTAVSMLKFSNGAFGIIDNSRQAVYGYDQRIEVFGSKGCIMVDNKPVTNLKIFTEKETKEDKIPYFFLERYKQSYINELRYFFNCLREGISPRPNGDDGLKNIIITRAAQKSFEEKRPVKISEIIP